MLIAFIDKGLEGFLTELTNGSLINALTSSCPSMLG